MASSAQASRAVGTGFCSALICTRGGLRPHAGASALARERGCTGAGRGAKAVQAGQAPGSADTVSTPHAAQAATVAARILLVCALSTSCAKTS